MTDHHCDELDDDDIILGLMDEDEGALRTLLVKYGSTIRAMAVRKFTPVLQGPEIDEVVTRTVMKVWRSAGRYDDKKASLKGWLLFIAVREGQRIIRDTKQQRHLQLDDQYDVPDDDPPVEIDKKQRKDLRRLREVIDALPPLQKAIIEADLQSGDVADAGRLALVHGTTKNSIYASRNKARGKIRDELKGFFKDVQNQHGEL